MKHSEAEMHSVAGDRDKLVEILRAMASAIESADSVYAIDAELDISRGFMDFAEYDGLHTVIHKPSPEIEFSLNASATIQNKPKKYYYMGG